MCPDISGGPAARRRILLVGWDAADWQVIDPLLDAGKMPNLARLVERGAIADLATLHPPYSPILWTSIATGKRPTKHGITGFIEPTRDARAVRPVSSLSRRCKALWNILGQNGLRSVVVGWYPSHPVEPITGVMVSDMFVKAGDGAQPIPLPPRSVHPPEWIERMDELRLASQEVSGTILRQFVPQFDKVDQSKDRRLHALAHVIAENMNAHAAATEAIEHADWDLACLFYDGIDHISHAFSRLHPPRLPWVSEEDFALYSGVLAACYRWHDAMLGRLLQLAGPDVTTIIVSDHGFECGKHRTPELPAELAGPTADHRQFGVLAMAGPGIRADERIYGASLLDVAPTVLHLFGLPVGRDMDGKVLLTALEDTTPIQRIPSWDAVAGEAGMHPPDATLDPLDAVEAMQQLVALGYIAPQSGDAANAVAEAVLEQHYTLAQSHDDAGRADLADEEYVKMLELRPTDHRAFSGRINALLTMGQIAAARGVLDAFDVAATNDAAAAREELARRQAAKPLEDLVAAPDEPAAKRDLHERQKLHQAQSGRTVPRQMLRARVLLASGDKDAALAMLEQVQAQIAKHGGVMPASFLAGFYAGAGRTDLALSSADTALQDDPTDWRVLSLRARLHLAAGRPEAAIADAAASLGLVYFQPATHALLAQAQIQQGQHEAAAQALHVAITQAPGLMVAHEALADLCTKFLDQPEQAAWHRAQATRLRDRRNVEKIDPDTIPNLRPENRPVFAARPGAVAPDGRDAVVVVAGLPRSGTSMLMQAMAAAGVSLLTDGQRAADEDNPRGYHEYEPATRLAEDSAWIAAARGRAVKIVLPLLPHLPRGEAYRVLLIQRDLREVLASQARMLQRRGRRPSSLRPRALAAQYISQERIVLNFLQSRPGIGVLPLDYDLVLRDPHGTAQRIAAFVVGAFDAAACAAAIEPGLRRQHA